MLRIYDDALWMVREVYAVAKEVEKGDGDLARQMRRASSSVALNISEGNYSRKGNRRARWHDAMGSANETRSALQVVDAVGLAQPSPELLDRLDKIVATLWKLTRYPKSRRRTESPPALASTFVVPRAGVALCRFAVRPDAKEARAAASVTAHSPTRPVDFRLSPHSDTKVPPWGYF